MQELRTALTEAYVAANVTPPTYTDAIVAGQTTIKAIHIAELGSAASALE